ncbi:MAG TPA: HAD-IIIA family hydrolase, partial [Candidatus Bilamarchaeaceae archaeon]|nr:HAD-IIIA family hydrolase [Candidatus Bilamarchaeaceae archaeon]
RGLCAEDEVHGINKALVRMLEEKGAKIDAIYYCPHHPDKGYPGENPAYKMECECRKPKAGMLREAAAKFGVALKDCFMVGDRTVDVQTARNAGCKSILVKTGFAGKDGKHKAEPDYVCENMLEAAKLISLEGTRAVIVAGGLGKRLAPLTETVPKPMLPLRGRPMLERMVEWLRREGIREIVVCSGYLSEKMEEYFGDGARWGVRISYSVEKEPLGTGGALKNAEKLVGKGTFVAMYADLDVDMDLERFVRFHREKGGIATLTVHPSSHPYDSDMVGCDGDGKVVAFPGKPKPGEKFENLGNAGIYCFESDVFKYLKNGKSNLDKEVLPSVLGKEGIHSYRTDEKIMDVGTHDRYGGN